TIRGKVAGKLEEPRAGKGEFTEKRITLRSVLVRLSLNPNPERGMESFAGIDNTQLLATGERAGGGSHRLECDEVGALRREHLRVTVVLQKLHSNPTTTS